MQYVYLLIIAALVFGLCFLIDFLFKKLFPKSKLEGSKRVVRMPRRSAIWGLILTLFPVVVLLFWLPPEGDTALTIGCVVAILFGLVLLVQYFSFGIWYDEETFLFKDLRRGRRTYHYSQIKGQQSLMTRSGIQATIFVGEDVIEVSSAMQGLPDFLDKAFYRWCAAKGIDPDSVENNPAMLTYFPALEEKDE